MALRLKALPPNEVRLITKAAVKANDYLYRQGFRHNKAELLLNDLRQPGEYTDDLVAEVKPSVKNKLINLLDKN